MVPSPHKAHVQSSVVVGLGHAVCSRGTRILFHNFIFHTFIVTWLVVALIIFFPPAVFRLPSLKVAEFSSAQLINFRLPTHEAQQGFLKRIGVPSLPRRYLSYSASTPPGAAHTEEESVANVKHTRTFFFFSEQYKRANHKPKKWAGARDVSDFRNC